MALRPFDVILAAALAVAPAATALAQQAPQQDLPDPDPATLPFLDLQDNVVEFASPQALSTFYEKWNTPARDRIVIAHFGDSLIQGGSMTGAARARLQAEKGFGGRGMIFPYAVAKSYDQEDYKSSFTGSWTTANSMQQPPKLPVGISGFTAHTGDARFSFAFTFTKAPPTGPVRVRMLYRSPGAEYRYTVRTGGRQQTVSLPTDREDARTHVLTMTFERVGDVLEFDLARLDPSATTGRFELYGVDLESGEPGLIYHNLGVGGAAFSALDEQALYFEQIHWINPDLVVLDWGTNDILYNNAVAPDLEALIRRTIAKVRAVNPRAAIVLTSAQDMTYRGKSITAAWDFAQLVRRVAFETGCLFYDWYRVSGGAYSRERWQENGLSNRDNVHLNGRGYRTKGELFARALQQSFARYGAGETRLVLPPMAPPARP